MTTKTIVPVEIEVEMGPAMLALPTDRQRAFVVNFCARGGTANGHEIGDPTKAARAAGYADTPSLHTMARWLLDNEKVQAAIVEHGKARLHAMVPRALEALEDILIVPGKDQLAAVKTVLNRAGLQERVTTDVNIKVTLTDAEKIAAIRRNAVKLGIGNEEVERLIGRVVDAEFTEVAVQPPKEDWAGLDELTDISKC